MRRIVFLLGCFASAPLAAEPIKLKADAIKSSVTGSMLELDTPLGTTVSIRFGQDGLMSGDAKTLASLLGAATDRGRWWVANDQLCYKWFRWFDSESRCLSISQEAKRIFWERDDGESGTATIIEQIPSVVKPTAPSVVAKAADVMRKDDRHETEIVVAQANVPAAAIERTQLAMSASLPVGQLAAPQTLSPPIKATTLIVAHVPAPRPAVRPKRMAATVTAAPPAFKIQTPAKLEAKSFRVAGVEPTDVLNIRNGPSQDNDPVGEIPPTGRGIVIIGRCQDDWCPIKHRGRTGWVNRYYLAEEMPR